LDPRKWAWSTQVGHSLNLIAELPQLAFNEDVPTGAQVACIDDFFSIVRALVEFLVRPRRTRDIHRHDYVLWDPRPSRRVETLSRAWREATWYVSHLSKARVPKPGDIVQRVQQQRMVDLGREVFALMEEFVAALRDADSEYADMFAAYLDEARRRAGA
jgi:hypothetical protein